MSTNSTTSARKTSKVRVNAVMVRDSTLEKLTILADELGKNSPAALLGEVAEQIALADFKAKNWTTALSEFLKAGSK